MNTDRDTITAPDPDAWRRYRDPLSVPVPPCQHCGEPVRRNAYAILADGRMFCSAACYESWVRR